MCSSIRFFFLDRRCRFCCLFNRCFHGWYKFWRWLGCSNLIRHQSCSWRSDRTLIIFRFALSMSGNTRLGLFCRLIWRYHLTWRGFDRLMFDLAFRSRSARVRNFSLLFRWKVGFVLSDFGLLFSCTSGLSGLNGRLRGYLLQFFLRWSFYFYFFNGRSYLDWTNLNVGDSLSDLCSFNWADFDGTLMFWSQCFPHRRPFLSSTSLFSHYSNRHFDFLKGLVRILFDSWTFWRRCCTLLRFFCLWFYFITDSDLLWLETTIAWQS